MGFIRKLPTALIAAFRATLEEVSGADLLIHVVDASDPDWAAQEQAVLEILKSLGQGGLSRITAFNKMDLLSASQKAAFKMREGFLISTKSGEGLQALLKAVEARLAKGWIEKELQLTHQEGARLSDIYESMEVLSKRETGKTIFLRVRAHPTTLARFLKS